MNLSLDRLLPGTDPDLRIRFRPLLRPALQMAREARFLGRLGVEAPGQGAGRRAVFLPACGPRGAALLRIYLVALGLRRLGWRTHILPPELTLAQRRRWLGWLAPDVIVMQGTRHPLNRPALYPGQTIVLDIDDADFHLDHLAASVSEAMYGVRAVIAGSEYIADWCRGAGAVAVDVVWTGAPVTTAPPPQACRPPVVAWAQTRPMTYVREAALVRRVMARVAAARPGVTLRLYDRMAGDDPGFAESFRAPGLAVEWCDTARYGDYLCRFDDVALGLAPLCPEVPFSRGKSFGKVLAYLDRGVPVIGSDAGEHGAFFTTPTGVITNDPEVWTGAALQLLSDAPARAAMAGAAREAFRRRLSIAAAVDRLDGVLRGVIGADGVARAG